MAKDDKKLTQQWWFWTAIGIGATVLVVIVLSFLTWRRRTDDETRFAIIERRWKLNPKDPYIKTELCVMLQKHLGKDKLEPARLNKRFAEFVEKWNQSNVSNSDLKVDKKTCFKNDGYLYDLSSADFERARRGEHVPLS